MSQQPIVMYHGARAWSGPPSVQRGRAKRTEHGPGIYLTTSYATARKYSKGGGVVMRVLLSPDLTWAEDATIPIADAIAFVRNQRGMRKKNEIIADLQRNSAKHLGSDTIGASVLSNLAVNYDALVGDAAPAMAQFFARCGIDAGLNETWGDGKDEDWIVLFNPSKILSHDVVGAKKKYDDTWHLPLVRTRRAR